MPPTKKDYDLQHQVARTSFREPLPSFIHRSAPAPSRRKPSPHGPSADAGRFSLSLKGMRRDLRKAGGRAEKLVSDVEGAILDWLQREVTLLPTDGLLPRDMEFPGTPIGSSALIREVLQTPFQLIWCTDGDPFARYIVHCCARYHNIVSFSVCGFSHIQSALLKLDETFEGKDQSGKRLTFLLRPQGISRPNAESSAAVAPFTPPATDLEYSSNADSDSELASLLDAASLARPLSALSELSAEDVFPSFPPAVERDWSQAGYADVDSDNQPARPSEQQVFSQSSESLILDMATHAVARARRLRQHPLNMAHNRPDRRALSPSRSPSPILRLPTRPIPVIDKPQSFYDYLYK